MSKRTELLQEFHQALEVGGVDEKRGVISGVSIITSGLTAVGHQIEVDDTTLLEMQAAARARGKVPVKWNHKTGADEVCGYLRNFRIDDSKLKADWHLLKSHPRREQALELANEMPESVGLSASFFGTNEKKGGKEYARCAKLQSVDLVAAPAANPDGLFEARVDSDGETMAKNQTAGEGEAGTVDMSAVLAKLTELSEQNGELLTRLSTLEEGHAGLVAGNGGGNTDDGDDDEDADEASEFESLGEVMAYFESRLSAAENAREAEREEQAFAEVEERFGRLLELNEQLAGENAMLAQAYHALSAHTGTEVELSAGASDEAYEVEIKSQRATELTAYEARCQELQRKEGKDAASAMIFAMEENEKRYLQHLEAKGAFAQQL